MARPKKSEVKDRVVYFTDQNGIKKMNITKVVKKQVTNPVSGQKVERKANITFTVPTYSVSTIEKDGKKVQTVAGLDLAGAIQAFGSADRMILYAIAGLWNHIRTNESNDLARADKATRQLAKAAKNLKAVMPGFTDEALRAMLMSNPEFAKTFENQEFVLEVNKTVDVLAQENGAFKLEPPVIEPGEDESDEDETEDEAAS